MKPPNPVNLTMKKKYLMVLKMQAMLTSEKFEKTEPKYSICSFQNGGSLTFKGASSERCFAQARPK